MKGTAWIDALRQLADDKAGAVEIDRKRALHRRDLIIALKGRQTALMSPHRLQDNVLGLRYQSSRYYNSFLPIALPKTLF